MGALPVWVSVYHVGAVPSEARRWHQILLNWTVRELGCEPCSSLVLTAEPSLHTLNFYLVLIHGC